jgi:cytochrome P450
MVARFLLPRFLWSLFSVSSNSPKIKAAKDELDNMLKKLAAERREAIKEGRIGQEKWEMDVLQRLLLSSTESNVTDEEIFGELLGFFLAGHETTANTLTFAILELCKNPEIQQKLYESVKDIELSKGTDCLPLIDASAVKYLDNFLKEVQRLHSIVPKVPRTCNDNVDLQGHFVPRGALIHVYLKGIHLNPK